MLRFVCDCCHVRYRWQAPQAPQCVVCAKLLCLECVSATFGYGHVKLWCVCRRCYPEVRHQVAEAAAWMKGLRLEVIAEDQE